jgi:hypothetical protein
MVIETPEEYRVFTVRLLHEMADAIERGEMVLIAIETQGTGTMTLDTPIPEGGTAMALVFGPDEDEGTE